MCIGMGIACGEICVYTFRRDPALILSAFAPLWSCCAALTLRTLRPELVHVCAALNFDRPHWHHCEWHVCLNGADGLFNPTPWFYRAMFSLQGDRIPNKQAVDERLWSDQSYRLLQCWSTDSSHQMSPWSTDYGEGLVWWNGMGWGGLCCTG